MGVWTHNPWSTAARTAAAAAQKFVLALAVLPITIALIALASGLGWH